MQFLGDGLEGVFLYLKLRTKGFLFIHIFYLFHLLFLSLLSSLIKKKNSHDKSNQQQSQYDTYDRDKVYFWVLILHKKAIVNKEYRKIFKIMIMLRKFLIISLEMPLKKLVIPNNGNPQQ